MIIYTAIFDHFDQLRPPRGPHGGHNYVCICNPPLRIPAPWSVSVRPTVITPRRSARYYKILSHKAFPDAPVTVWHGGNVQLRKDPRDLLDIMGDNDIAVLKHSERTSPYHEAEACINWQKSTPSTVHAQMARYRQEGFPGDRLSMLFLIVRRHTGRIKELNELWWSEIEQGSIRDQLSFDYACWKLGIVPSIIPGGTYRGPHYVRYEHRK